MSKCEVDIPKNSRNIRTHSLSPKINTEDEISAELLNQAQKEKGTFMNYEPVLCQYCGHYFLVLYDT